MNRKHERISAQFDRPRTGQLDPRYLAYFDCFNAQRFYEAHDVLEHLWLEVRRDADGNFFKGLIQLAGAFVHVQKGRIEPALALLSLAEGYLSAYPATHYQLEQSQWRTVVAHWKKRLGTAGTGAESGLGWETPRLELAAVAPSAPEPDVKPGTS